MWIIDLFDLTGSDTEPELVAKMASILRHRGPDDTEYGDARLESDTRKHKYSFCINCRPATRTYDEKRVRRNMEYFGKHADLVLGCGDLVESRPRHEGMWFSPMDRSGWWWHPLSKN